jgi:hypothetical protein
MNRYRDHIFAPVDHHLSVGRALLEEYICITSPFASDRRRCNVSFCLGLFTILTHGGVCPFNQAGHRLALLDLKNRLLSPAIERELLSRGVHMPCIVEWRKLVKAIWKAELPPPGIQLTAWHKAGLEENRAMIDIGIGNT